MCASEQDQEWVFESVCLCEKVVTASIYTHKHKRVRGRLLI